MITGLRLRINAGLWWCLLLGPCGGASAQDDLFEKAAEILEMRCVQCHKPQDSRGGLSLHSRQAAMDGGERGAAVVAGNPEASLLVQLISGDSPEMPQSGNRLEEHEISTLRAWIAAGLPWPDDRVLVDRSLPDTDWWSLQPLASPEIPRMQPAENPPLDNPIDRFILDKLRSRGLNPSPPAERRILIRRLALDLTGLPPTIEEVQAFCSDPDPAAYERLVDRLLDSPRYGERWARHWLDVVHYGETHGYDKDQPRPHAWPYRDYVVRALNQDKPYARFIQEQIAGDILFPGTEDGITGLGFIAAGPWDLIGHAEVPESKIDGKIARHLDRDDMVSNTMSTFQSMTVHCAQCHDHKFDPVSQEDYYALQANFAALDRADRAYDQDPQVAQQRAELVAEKQRLQSQIHALEESAKREGGEALAALERLIESVQKSNGAVSERYGWHSAIESTQEAPKWVQVDLGSAADIVQVILHPCHDDFNGIGQGFGFPERFRVEVSDDPEFAVGVQLVVDETQSDFPNPGIRPVDFRVSSTARYVRVTATKLAPRQNDFIFALAELEVVDAQRVNLASCSRVDSADSVEAPPRWQRENLTDGWYPGVEASGMPDQATRLEQLQESKHLLLQALLGTEWVSQWKLNRQLLQDVESKIADLPPQSQVFCGTVYSGSGNFVGTGAAGGQPRPIAVLARGDVRTPLEPVTPGTLRVFPQLNSRFEQQLDAGEGQRRAALAAWLSHPDNPLTWRSIVNRVWQYHFGTGIVETASDFGRMGDPPSHPELLDWLAVWFRDEAKGSLKSLHRLIVTSRTYCQSSTTDAAQASQAEELDGSNRLLWRQNRRRLEAEAIRDSILAVAGKLDLTMGGPSFQDFVITHPEHSPHYEYHLADLNDPKLHRRSIYRFIVRSQQQPWMAAWDCADPSVLVDKRNQTITPLQALAQLNNQLVLVMSRHFAARVSHASLDPAERVATAFRIAVQREPTDSELAELAGYAQRHGLENACRLILNLNELVFID